MINTTAAYMGRIRKNKKRVRANPKEEHEELSPTELRTLVDHKEALPKVTKYDHAL